MPSVRKLAPDEVLVKKQSGTGQRKLVEEQYDAILSEYTIGDYGEAEPEQDENRLTIRNRLKAAARRRGLALEFRRTRGPVIRFRVISTEDATDEDATEDE
jgi:hypothetical protein